MTPPPSLQDLIETVRQDSPTASPLDLLVTASATVGQLEDLNDALLEHFVSGCRREGKSWSEISAALGVSKQAVHKRFSGPLADQIISRADRNPTFERFTLRARAALQAAARAAIQRGGAEVDAADLLDGLLAVPEGLAAMVLTGMGVTAEAVRAARPAPAAARPAATSPAASAPAASAPADSAPADSAPAGPAGAAPGDPGAARPPFAAEAATALRNALAVALELGHDYIGTEHMLLGLLRDPDAPAAAMLSQLGATPAEARVRVAELLRGFQPPPAATP